MTRYLAALTLFFTATFVLSPALTEPFMGYRPDQLPIPQVDPPAQPAGYAFAIWGLIYAWLAVSALFGVIRRRDDADWNTMRGPLIVSLAIGTPWLWIANHSPVWATVTIFAMAGAAILAAIRAPKRDRWWAFAPVSIYAGWLTAASFVSLAATAAGNGVLTDGFGWAIIAILGATFVALIVLGRLRHRTEYALTLAWALIGIIVSNGTDPLWVSGLATAAIAAVAARAIPAP